MRATSQDGAIGLDWDAAGAADAYRVYRSTSSGVDASGSPLNTGISSAEYVDESAESDPSSEIEKTPFSDPPDRP